MDKYIGKWLDGRYEMLELIGVGGMANVYKAHDQIENRTVAVKILREEYMSNEEFVRRFKNESKAIAILNHPNIVKVYDVIFTPQTQSIVMEYIDGVSLKDYIGQQGRIKWREAVYFTMQILRGLQHAHDRGIVHRDIKPQNIMLLCDGTIKITDFGIARFARAETHTLTDRAIGSVHYISPEQARGGVTDEKTDLYSVGVMLFEMLTGQLPFEADSPVSVAIKQIQSIPKRPRDLNPDIPEGLEEITLRAMQKDVSRRYHSAAEMLRDIDTFKRDPSVSFAYQFQTGPESLEPAGNGTPPRRRQPGNGAGATRESATGSQRMRSGASEEEEQIVKKTPVLPILGGVAGAFLLVSSLFIFWMFYTNNPFESNPEVRLPDFVGKTFSTVQEQYGDKFHLTRENVPSAEAVGVVIEQVPKAGARKVREGSTVTLKVSSGLERVTIEDYTGMNAGDVLDALHAKGLKASQSNIHHPSVAKGCVIKTDPPQGSQVTTDTPITVYVSLGEEKTMVTVPDLVGRDREEGKAVLARLRLKMGEVKNVTFEELEKTGYDKRGEDGELIEPVVGAIVAQEPKAGGEGESGVLVEEGTRVNVTVYTGRTDTRTLNVTISNFPRLDREIRLKAVMAGRVVKEEAFDLTQKSEWTVPFSSEDYIEEAELYIDGELWLVLEIDFEEGTFLRVEDYSEDF